MCLRDVGVSRTYTLRLRDDNAAYIVRQLGPDVEVPLGVTKLTDAIHHQFNIIDWPVGLVVRDPDC